jgi:triosephosphate isomerase
MAGNWKMYKNASETRAYFQLFLPQVRHVTDREIVICPPFPNLEAAVNEVRGSSVKVGAQNLYWGKEGAVTGEVSGPMIQHIGCTHVIIAHSERREYFRESEEDVIRKTRAALEVDLSPIVCVGERLAERESGQTESVLVEQFRGGISGLAPAEFTRIVIAYEPVWAIGTGKTATPEIAEDAHRIIREQARARFGNELAEGVRILYGGSVKPDNVRALMAKEQIDGVLVGGASLNPDSFAAIVNF